MGNVTNSSVEPAIVDFGRVRSGVDGLDDILHGGFTRGRLHLIEGSAGTGKTTMGVQFLLEGARSGESGLYITLSENRIELLALLDSHGWPRDQFRIYVLDVIGGLDEREGDYTFFHPAEIELASLSKLLADEIETAKPLRVVFDSLSELRLLARDPLRFRREILRLKGFLLGANCTVLLLDGKSSEDQHLQLHSTVSSVIKIDQTTTDYGSNQRNLTVSKMRASDFRGGRHDFRIIRGGVKIFPRLSHSDDLRVNPILAATPREVFSTGLNELDVMLDGGLRSGSCNIIEGRGGTGRSSLAAHYAFARATRGQKVAIFLFDEGATSYLERSKRIGLDMSEFIKQDVISIRHLDPAEISPGEFANLALSFSAEGFSSVIIDSLNGFISAMPSEKFLMLQMQELVNHLDKLGTILVIVADVHQQRQQATISSADLSFLAEVVVETGHYQLAGATEKYIKVKKNRSGAMDPFAHEFKISSKGVSIGLPLIAEAAFAGTTMDYIGGVKSGARIAYDKDHLS